MKQITFFCGAVLALVCASTSGALEMQAMAGGGNTAFNHEREDALGLSGGTFVPNNYFVGSIDVKGEYSDFFDFTMRFECDPLLRARALGGISFNFNYGRLEMGPLIGLFNSKEQPLTAGVSGTLQLEYPGIIFASLKASSTLASMQAAIGDYSQSEGEAALGFWVPNVICTFSINKKDFSTLMSDTLLARDTQVRYNFSSDVYSKNVPYTIRIDLGYQVLKRYYIPMRTAVWEEAGDEFKMVYGGFEGTWRVAPPLRILLALEMPFYTWSVLPMKKDTAAVFIQAQAGIIWTFKDKHIDQREYPK